MAPRGGHRPNSGPNSSPSPYGESTKVVRIPVSRVEEVKRYLAQPRIPAWGEVEYLGAATSAIKQALPLFPYSVPAGFPSPAEDYAQGKLDLNEYLVEHEAATFCVRVKGHSMTGAGILDGDIIVVDRALEARHGDIVLAVIDNELTVKELHLENGWVRLLPNNPDFPPIDFKTGQELTIWGVVKGVVRKLR
jgi:DNA polymerase V